MNYQQVLSLPYVVNLVESIVNSKNSHMSNNINIIKIDEEYYYKYSSKKDLHYINENINNKLGSILNTIIKFEEFKDKPLDYFIIKKYNVFRDNIDQGLLHFLQLQYAVDKTYFQC
jgi:hypothetical protein